MSSMKSPKIYRMPILFYQKYWYVVDEDITRATRNIFNGNDPMLEINYPYIVFIPKIKAPQDLSHCRPISLCNVLYKIIRKVMARKLKIILPRIIFESQSAFARGRQILDNVLIA